ncbi:MAG: hypothetical protein M1820_004757 [Bogoriella megaspora]|nr:MAG: hypothetical protein M1820_004757 [Bogoriella megaspora]
MAPVPDEVLIRHALPLSANPAQFHLHHTNMLKIALRAPDRLRQSVDSAATLLNQSRRRQIEYCPAMRDLTKRSVAETPKVALDPVEEDKLSGDMRELYDRLKPTEESIEARSKLVQKLETLLNRQWPGRDIKVHVFGSSGNMLCSNDSDVDICITTPMKELEKVCLLAEVLAKNGMQQVVCVSSAKVPIVKIWDPELKLKCDLNVNNTDALENTRMIKTYVQIDDRVRPLAMIIKHWTSRRIINDAAMGATISSYTWLCMVLNFLQTRKPPLLPILHQMPHLIRRSGEGKRSTFADDLKSLEGYGKQNKESLGQLLFQFFRKYGYEVDYEKYVISVRQGKLLTREAKGWPLERRLCVEEPFNTYRNLGNSADDYSFHGIHEEIRRAFDLLADGIQLEKCFEQYEFPPLEKNTFRKPEPKPKPILSRSHSQTRRSSTTNGPSNLSLKGKHPFNQRNGPGGRRSSSGATFGQPRFPYAQSPPVGLPGNDYFGVDNLHDQLVRQYQLLSIQQDFLKAQMVQAQGQPLQGQIPTSRSLGSPNHRSIPNGASNVRRTTIPNADPSQHGTIPPGFLYHFPVDHGRPQIPPQSIPRDSTGTSTNPSSPSLMAAVPALHRVHRSTANDGSSAASVRSQSQPGRSNPNPLTSHAYAHPGFDVSGAIGHPLARTMLGYMANGQPGITHGYPHTAGLSGPSIDPGMAKEYVGYYVGESPQLIPQYVLPSSVAIPPYTDIPIRRRRPSPDLAPPEGLRRSSRSPSPLGRSRTYSNGLRSAPLPGYVSYQEPFDLPDPSQDEPPLVVNGSYPVTPYTSNPTESSSGGSVSAPALGIQTNKQPPRIPEFGAFGAEDQTPVAISTSHRFADLEEAVSANLAAKSQDEHSAPAIPAPASEATSKTSNEKNEVTATTSQLESDDYFGLVRQHKDSNGGKTTKTILDRDSEQRPMPVPHLSPVFETQSPSPIISRRRMESSHVPPTPENHPLSNGSSKESESKLPAGQLNHPGGPISGSMPRKESSVQAVPTAKIAASGNGHTNGWQQQKSRKGGRRRANSNEERARPGMGGEPLPTNESERKGG